MAPSTSSRSICILFLVAYGISSVLGATGPAFNHTQSGIDWPSLSGTVNGTLCGSGKNQSPINISPLNVSDTNGTLAPLVFAYPSNLTSFNVTNEGAIPIQLDIEGNYTVTLPNGTYPGGRPLVLQQFHFHTPGEHMIDGIFYAAEMHLVHKDPVSGQLSVVTVLLKLHAGDVDNPELAQFFPQASNTYNVTVKGSPSAVLDLNRLLPSSPSYWHYAGSLTAPPCTENVLWFIFTTPLTMSTSQLLKLQLANAGGAKKKADNRLVQPLNGRTIQLYGQAAGY